MPSKRLTLRSSKWQREVEQGSNMECDGININSNCNNGVDSCDESTRVCHGCSKPIEDEYSLHINPGNLQWHSSCLTCFQCNMTLDENIETCFIKDGKLYCRSDYVSLFGNKCARCFETICMNTPVMKARNQIYHAECFRCTTCDKQLSSGEQYGISGGRIYCKADLENQPPDLIPIEDMDDSSVNSNGGVMNTAPPGTTSTGSHSTRKNSEKPPRVRTVLTEHQLQTLRSIYSTNPRPDALLKEQLCELTGLSPRVIRVWFQNRRCKDKKKAQQAEAVRMQSMSGGKAMAITPQTPITPDSLSQVSPHGALEFIYPPPPSYEQLTVATPIPATPTHTCVSPIVSYQQGPAWGSPTASVPFDQTVDFSPITTEHQQQTYICTVAPSQLSQQTITHFPFS